MNGPIGCVAVRRLRLRAFPMLLILAVELVACQTVGKSAMSAEEARRATAQFGNIFVPPPRTVADITAILDQQQRENPEVATQARVRADQPAPNTTEPNILTEFYYQRGLAAREIGRTQQEIGDLTEAVRWAARRSSPEARYGIVTGGVYYSLLGELSRAESVGGNYSRALEYLRRAIDDVPSGHRSAEIYFYAALARAYAGSGDLEAAEAATRTALRLRNEWNVRPGARPAYIAGRNASVAGARASVLEAKGQFADAEVFWRQSVAALERDPIRSQEPAVELTISGLAINLMRQQRLVEAESEARAALLKALRRGGRNSSHTARIVVTLARVIAEQGRYAEAERLARAAIDIYEKTRASSDSYSLALARDALGAALVAQARWQEALAQYDVVRNSLGNDSFAYRASFAGNVNWALALLNAGQSQQACGVLHVAFERSKHVRGDKHPSTTEIRAFLAMACFGRGDQLQAVNELSDAVSTMLAGPPEVDDETEGQPARVQRRIFILETYMSLLADIAGTPLERQAAIDVAAEAFRIADVARGQSVQRALGASAARTAARTPALFELVRREQDTAKQISALSGVLANVLTAPADQQDPNVVTGLRVRIDELRRDRQRVMREIGRDFPAYAELINPRPPSTEQARAALKPGEALIAIYVTPDRAFVWAIPRTGAIAFTRVPMGQKDLAAAVARLRQAVDARAKTVGDILEFDVALAYKLYGALLEPVRTGWQDAESLLIVPHGALGQVPFALLPTRPVRLGPEQASVFVNYRVIPWLVRTHAVTVLPSVSSLVGLRASRPGDPARRAFVGFGDPYFSAKQAAEAARERAQIAVASATTRDMPLEVRSAPNTQSFDSSQLAMLPRLPDTAEEIRSLARTMGADLTRDVFLGEQANEKVAKTVNLAAYRVVAFATHGLVPQDLDGLTQPALALTAPDVAKVDGDGVLTMEEILALRLDADWIILSACNTGSGDGAGAEAVSGLGRAFFYAGTRALLVSNWPVETTSARALTTELFRRQQSDPSLTRAKALQQTINWLIDDGSFTEPRSQKVVFSYAHPIFWAPFTLVGDGGARDP